MSLVKWAIFGLLMLPFVEIAVFVAVALKLGVLAALALTLLTSLAGMAIVRNAGHSEIAQVRGAFLLQVDAVSGIRDGETDGTKLVDAKAGIKLQHACFPNPLPIMGVKRGHFREDMPVSFLFRKHDDGWRLEKLVH